MGRLLSLRDVTERKRAEEALKESEEGHRRRARELALLHRVRTALVRELDPEAVCRAAVEAVAEAYGYALVSAYLLEGGPRERELVLQHQVGYATVIERIPVTEGVMGRAVRAGRSVLLEDATADPDFLGAMEGIVSEACVVLFDGDEAVGTLNVESTQGTRLSGDDLRLLEAVGEHAGMALGRARLHARVKEAEERYRTLVEGVPAVTYVSLQRPGKKSEVSYVSPQVERVLGYAPGEYAGDPSFWEGLLHPDDRERVLAADERAGETGGPFREEFRMLAGDGSVVWLREEGTLVRAEPDGTQVWHGVIFDVTELKLLEGELARQALRDPLTGLPNRRLLADRLGQALTRAGRAGTGVAVLFVDLDNFKYVNDSLGHETGDRLLVEAAGRLKRALRPSDTAARLGGDEFVAPLEDIGGVGEAVRVAERIAEALKGPFALDGHEAFVTASVGVALGRGATGREAAAGADDLLRRADLAMYQAKRGGKARHAVFDPASESRSMRRLELENGLRRALERDEIVVLYQPVVRLPTGGIAGFEALVRWERPGRGLVSPCEFVPLAEETGLIVPIGQRVLEEACRQGRLWQERFPRDQPLVVGANLSARQLGRPGLVGDVAAVLKETGLAPDTLTLEVTESALVEDAEAVLGALREIRALGARFAIDDFGTGYSSLSYLGRLPAGLLKVAGPLVGTIGGDGAEGDEVLLEGVVGIAHGLGLLVCAEGVETGGQLERLRAMGCDLAQGFLFSGPLTAEAATELLTRDPCWP